MDDRRLHRLLLDLARSGYLGEMQMRETKPEQVVHRDVLVAIVCDRCGKRQESFGSSLINWADANDRGWCSKGVSDLSVYDCSGGDADYDGVNLCFDCAKEIIEKIRNKQL